MSTANEQLVRSFFETLSSGDLERIGTFFDDETTWTVCAADIAGAGTHQGRRAIVDDFLTPVRGWFRPGDPKVEVLSIVADERLVMMEGRGRGTFLDGTPYENRYAFAFDIEDGRIRAIREYMDTGYAARIVAEATGSTGT